jgi:Sec-independent protein translocase protein TatA
MLPFGIGTGEIFMIFLVTFVVLGPAKIPEIARAIGKGLRTLRELTDEVKNSPEFQEIKNEVYQPIKSFDPKREINQFISQTMDPSLDKTSENLDPHHHALAPLYTKDHPDAHSAMPTNDLQAQQAPVSSEFQTQGKDFLAPSRIDVAVPMAETGVHSSINVEHTIKNADEDDIEEGPIARLNPMEELLVIEEINRQKRLEHEQATVGNTAQSKAY